MCVRMCECACACDCAFACAGGRAGDRQADGVVDFDEFAHGVERYIQNRALNPGSIPRFTSLHPGARYGACQSIKLQTSALRTCPRSTVCAPRRTRLRSSLGAKAVGVAGRDCGVYCLPKCGLLVVCAPRCVHRRGCVCARLRGCVQGATNAPGRARCAHRGQWDVSGAGRRRPRRAGPRRAPAGAQQRLLDAIFTLLTLLCTRAPHVHTVNTRAAVHASHVLIPRQPP